MKMFWFLYKLISDSQSQISEFNLPKTFTEGITGLLPYALLHKL